MKHLLLLKFLIALNLFPAFGQEIITTAGDLFSTSTHTLSWTIGEPIAESYENQSVLFSQGFQQSAQNYVGITEILDSLSFTIYPNPFSNSIKLCSDRDYNQVFLILFDATMGKVMQANYHFSAQIPIILETNSISNGIYFLQIQTDKDSAKTIFKLSKTW